LSAKARRTGEQPVNHLMHAAVTRPDLISLAAGLVDYETLPVDALRRCADTLLSNAPASRAALQYGTTAGLDDLREALLAQIESLDGVSRTEMSLTPDHLVVTTGSQQGLYLLSETLLDPGDIVITSAPSYFVYTHALMCFETDLRTVPMDAEGMCVDALERLLESLAASGELAKLKIIYVVSEFQNPSGMSLSPARRRRLIELVRHYGRSQRIVLVEDAAYRELRYEGDDAPSLKSLDPDNRYVALASTFSKAFSPGMRTGYLVLPDDLVSPVLWQKGNHDFGSQNLCQHLLLEVLRSGAYDEQVARLRRTYRAKRDAMLGALDEHLGDVPGVTWLRPQGGLYVWLTLPPTWDASAGGALFERCMQKGVMYVPGAYCYAPTGPDPAPVNEIRLSYGVAPAGSIAEGIRRLSAAIREEEAAAGSRGNTRRAEH